MNTNAKTNGNRNGQHGPVERPVPHDVDAEAAVCGSILMDRDAIVSVASFLAPEDFYSEWGRAIYRAAMSLYERRVPPDPQTVASELTRTGRMASIGGVSALVEMTLRTPTAVHIEHYARVVERAAIMRRLITAGGEIAGLGYSDELDASDVLAEADRRLMNVGVRFGTSDYVTMTEAVSAFADRLETLAQHPGRPAGISGNLDELDEITGGYYGGKMVVVAGRPGDGKTSFALGQALNIARAGIGVGVFSLEMPTMELLERWYSDFALVDSKQLRDGRGLNDHAWSRIAEATGRLAELPILIDDTANLPIGKLIAKATRMKAEHDIAVIVVDYLQLVSAPRKDNNRPLEVGEVARKLKVLARDLSVVVIACAQLNRESEKRANHVPQLADLRDSGEIEQHADIVMFIHRPERYGETEQNSGLAELHIAKHRGGPLGMVPLHFIKERTRFEAMTYRSMDEYGRIGSISTNEGSYRNGKET